MVQCNVWLELAGLTLTLHDNVLVGSVSSNVLTILHGINGLIYFFSTFFPHERIPPPPPNVD